MENSKAEMVWVDIETTGLNETTDVMLEIGIRITDHEGETVNEWSSIVSHPWYGPAIRSMDDFVQNMHTQNGLIKEVISNFGNTDYVSQFVEKQALDFLSENGVQEKLPMCGSNVANFDRLFIKRFMPALHLFFHYRNIDLSSVKELCKINNPSVFEMKPDSSSKTHRVADCLEETLNEYKFYRDNFLWVE